MGDEEATRHEIEGLPRDMRIVRRTEFAKPLTLVERFLMFLVYWLGTFCYRLLCSTYRVRHVGEEGRVFAHTKHGFCGALWHQRLFCAPFLFRKIPGLGYIVSQSKDGEMIRYVLEGLGHATFQGSSSRRGGAAFMEMARHLKSGGNLGITPDGPRGPARRVQQGILRLAMEEGTPIIAVAISAKDYWLAPSWDRFLFPLPFSRIVVQWGRPMSVRAGGSDEARSELGEKLRLELDRLADLADCEAGHAPLPRERAPR
ncbi:MAG: lysophospholipid acyltransferase family protein [Planctomycetota bacterium]|jgi:lysophospholipid acyltransferase (LPLAT)-like uncharacterized protein